LFTSAGKKGLVIWHYLKSNGQVFSSLLTKQETNEEAAAAKWQCVVVPPERTRVPRDTDEKRRAQLANPTLRVGFAS
jgi:hypothetical protein